MGDPALRPELTEPTVSLRRGEGGVARGVEADQESIRRLAIPRQSVEFVNECGCVLSELGDLVLREAGMPDEAP